MGKPLGTVRAPPSLAPTTPVLLRQTLHQEMKVLLHQEMKVFREQELGSSVWRILSGWASHRCFL